MNAFDAAELDARVQALLDEHDPKDGDAREFLGAQYDAGLAWVHLPRGFGGLDLPRTAQERVDARLAAAVAQVSLTVGQIVEAFTTVRKTWKARANPAWEISRKDEQLHLGRLLAPGFLVRTSWQWLLHYPRYLKTISQRLDKLAAGGHLRDQQLLAQVRPRWARGQDRKDQHAQRHVYDPELELYNGMAEEYRVATFAQELGTAISVSDKRLDKQWEKVAE